MTGVVLHSSAVKADCASYIGDHRVHATGTAVCYAASGILTVIDIKPGPLAERDLVVPHLELMAVQTQVYRIAAPNLDIVRGVHILGQDDVHITLNIFGRRRIAVPFGIEDDTVVTMGQLQRTIFICLDGVVAVDRGEVTQISTHIVHRKHAGRIHAYADPGAYKAGGVYLTACVQIDIRLTALDSRAAGDIYTIPAIQGISVGGF